MNFGCDLDTFNKRVTCSFRDQKWSGILELKKNHYPRLILDESTSDSTEPLSNGNIDQLLCVTNSGVSYTLLDSSIRDSFVTPKFIIEGEKPSKIYSFALELDQLDTLLYPCKTFKKNAEKIPTPILSPSFSSNFTFKEEQYGIKSFTKMQTSSTADSFQCWNHTRLCVTPKNKKDINYQDIEPLAEQLKILFSILAAYPLSIEAIEIETTPNRPLASFYFPSFHPNIFPMQTHWDCLCDTQLLFDTPLLWDNIFKKYFSCDHFQNTWNALYSMLYFQGPWEFRIAHFVMILDSYCSSEFKKTHTKEEQDKKLTSKIKKILTKQLIQNNKNPSNKCIKKIKKEKIGAPFEYKFQLIKEKELKDILGIIPFNENDFTCLKKIRNKVAHCCPQEESTSHNKSQIDTQTQKLITILFYLAFKDLGLTHFQFLHCLSKTDNTMFRFPGLDLACIKRQLKQQK